jgi:hypothetical protein
MQIEEKYLSKELLNKALLSGKEYGWKRGDVTNVIDYAYSIGLGIIGGQLQFKLPDGTCELYWRKFDPKERVTGEKWQDYCKRTRLECIELLNKLPDNKSLINEAVDNFEFLKQKYNNGVNLEEYLIFILYFDETGLEQIILYKKIDDILWNDWDPIGIKDYGGLRDEYQGYIPEIFDMIIKGQTPKDIAKKLNSIAKERMGLKGDWQQSKMVAKKLCE